MDQEILKLQEIIYQIRSFYFQNKRMPSFSELADLLGYSSKGAVRYVVDKLVERELIEKDEKGKLLPNKLFGTYPVLGSVQAGFPSPAEEELLDTISFDDFLVSNPVSTYLVKVSGDSMIEAGIMPGDIVIVDRAKEAVSGDVIIAEVDEEWTMKFFEKNGSKVRLLPANKKYKPIIPKQELKIGGVVVGCVRKF